MLRGGLLDDWAVLRKAKSNVEAVAPDDAFGIRAGIPLSPGFFISFGKIRRTGQGQIRKKVKQALGFGEIFPLRVGNSGFGLKGSTGRRITPR